MNFIKIGERYINLDNVAQIAPIHESWHRTGWDVSFVGPGGEAGQSIWIQDEDEVAALAALLAQLVGEN